MTITLAEVITQPQSGRTRAVVLDFHEYAQSVILQGREVPWQQSTAYSNFFGQAQGLLKPDVALLDLGTLYANALDWLSGPTGPTDDVLGQHADRYSLVTV